MILNIELSRLFLLCGSCYMLGMLTLDMRMDSWYWTNFQSAAEKHSGMESARIFRAHLGELDAQNYLPRLADWLFSLVVICDYVQLRSSRETRFFYVDLFLALLHMFGLCLFYAFKEPSDRYFAYSTIWKSQADSLDMDYLTELVIINRLLTAIALTTFVCHAYVTTATSKQVKKKNQ
mmetsp:Transcript_10568/g.12138  ORF Transcript_10568/g.12138 Transcript_10568/m.12138 type:complete len:178 (+) Transcript_10568:227-760(+)